MDEYDMMIERLRAEPWAILHDAADMMVTMQAENERLKRELEISKLDTKEWHSQADALQSKLDAMGSTDKGE